jgi:hypothetical protein
MGKHHFIHSHSKCVLGRIVGKLLYLDTNILREHYIPLLKNLNSGYVAKELYM